MLFVFFLNCKISDWEKMTSVKRIEIPASNRLGEEPLHQNPYRQSRSVPDPDRADQEQEAVAETKML